MLSGWVNLEAVTDAQLFDNEKHAFSFLGLTRTQRRYGLLAGKQYGYSWACVL